MTGKDDINKEAVKFDQDKTRYDLIPPNALQDLAMVYTMGSQKYAARNWEIGLDWSRVFGALMRHSWAWFRGETHDPESGLHHMAHAAWSCLALVEYHYTKKGKDDRPYEESNKIPDRRSIGGVTLCSYEWNGCLLSTTETGNNADQRSAQDRS